MTELDEYSYKNMFINCASVDFAPPLRRVEPSESRETAPVKTDGLDCGFDCGFDWDADFMEAYA